jgi:hypothetical protein
MLERIICPCCEIKLVAINYYKNGKVYYRKRCDQCTRKKKSPKPPAWVRSGYKKKEKCERCGKLIKFEEAAVVYHIDGNIKNADKFNLKTICLVCEVELNHSNTGWKPGRLAPDI